MSSAGFDRIKFVLVEALHRHTQSLLHKSLVSETRIDLPHICYSHISDIIEKRRWETFCAQLEAAVILVVREFYANVVEHENGVAFGRGKRVPFDSHTINRFYGTPNLENDEYTQYSNGEVDLEEVISLLGNLRTT
ncbi:Uncharacterized protein TCM_028331 [Theobroma cacao]|uniref:Putative plant transposon protein domain-containing protein n=1 Tax=Theobroma cacao TaxID=3641 RepID=A0A061GHL1_THECC|nr:Uncharacterized protein TCM_028331 [Theobroma cacao]